MHYDPNDTKMLVNRDVFNELAYATTKVMDGKGNSGIDLPLESLEVVVGKPKIIAKRREKVVEENKQDKKMQPREEKVEVTKA